ncbi:MAG: gamma-glutamylcyclotransferase [Parcubacteria group bacterium]|nr:gamma-glutamylcyclotransferase [Parcubacteria group bacterium]
MPGPGRELYCVAYGTLLNPLILQKCAPNARFMGIAEIENYELVFDGQSRNRPGATANIVYAPGYTVWGALYCIPVSDQEGLNAFEGCPEHYNLEQVDILLPNGRKMMASAYCRTGREKGKPCKSYLKDVVDGAEHRGLPASYIYRLEDIETVD